MRKPEPTATGTAADEARSWQQLARGICSDPDCGAPIDGTCVWCGGKFCTPHLVAHVEQASARGLVRPLRAAVMRASVCRVEEEVHDASE